MLVEIPDPDVILSVILAFIAGIGGLYAYIKVKPIIKMQKGEDSSQAERLEYYERQLIDMKIRLDALEINDVEPQSVDSNLELKQFLEKLAKNEGKERIVMKEEPETKPEPPKILQEEPKFDHNNPIDYVLHLITNKPMTSRDIQITLKRSREHTSRLMKKLFEDGFVERNTESKPYTYSISKKGKEKIGLLEISSPVV